MRLVVTIYKNEEIEYLHDYIDYAMIMVPHLSINYSNIDVDKAILSLSKYNKGIILNINRIMHEKDLSILDKFFDNYMKYGNILFLISDLGALKIAKDKKIENRIIYNPETMITNYLDLSIYDKENLNAIGLSEEITLDDVIKCMNYSSNIYYQIFGRRLMFYSRRKLISLYEEKNNDKYPHEAFLRESTRTDLFPIYENDECTTIYRGYNINYLKELELLSNIKYGYIETLNLNKEESLIILKAFNESLKDYSNIYKNLNIINSLNLSIEDGFKYKDSVYQKEELKNV